MHPIRRLLAEFENRDKLPIEPDEVRRWIEQNGFCDELVIYYPNCDPEAFNGIYIEKQGRESVRRTSPYGDLIYTREIFVNDNQPLVEKRLAEVKEQVHILDVKSQRTTTRGGVDSLINFAATGVGAPSEGSREEELLTDLIVADIAAQILFPMAMRNRLKQAHADQKITIPKIAAQAVLSEVLIERMLEEDWPAVCSHTSFICDMMSRPINAVSAAE